MNPNAVARAGTTSAPMTKCGDVYAIAIKMDTILDMSQISNRFVRNGRKRMAEYVSKTDVLNLPQSIERNLCGEIVERSVDVKDIESLEPADVVQVIRCDDCVYYGSRRWCELHSSVFDDNAFCSYGERREE